MGIVDTGAAMSALPAYVHLGLGENLVSSSRRVRGADSVVRIERSIFATVVIGDWLLTDHELIVLPHRYFVIGRDILNAYRIVLDGPRELWMSEV
jgi:hypothetical protein